MTETDPTPILVDGHLDLAYNALVLQRDLTQPVAALREQERRSPNPDPKSGIATVSFPDLLEGRVAVVGGSIFVEPGRKSYPTPLPTYETPAEARTYAVEQLDYYRRITDERGELRLLLGDEDLDEVLSSWEGETPQLGIFVVMEGADPIRDPGDLAWWVERGLRGVGLTWAAGTRYAGGNANPGSLSDEGESLLDAMADYNLLLDISHLWEDAAYRALDRYPGPVVATHANPRFFVDNPRHLSDDMIRRVAERAGVVGIVAYNPMLDPGWHPGAPPPPLGSIVQAIDHVCQITGEIGYVGLGSDLDGGFGQASTPAGLNTVADLVKLVPLLKERGYTEHHIRAIMHENWLRMMRSVLDAM
jgi:membrane dipeptidase